MKNFSPDGKTFRQIVMKAKKKGLPSRTKDNKKGLVVGFYIGDYTFYIRKDERVESHPKVFLEFLEHIAKEGDESNKFFLNLPNESSTEMDLNVDF